MLIAGLLQKEGEQKLKLEVDVADVSQAKKDLTIEVAADEVKAEYDKTYDAYTRYAKVPGFRPGRVPRGVVKQRFSKDVKDEVIGRLLPEALRNVIIDKKLRVIGEPRINEVTVSEGEPLKFTASVEILPEFDLKDYKGLKAKKHSHPVTGEDVERVIERWRENAAEFVPIEDRPSQDGDYVSVNLVGKHVEPPEEEDLTADDLQIELGAEGVQAEFDENLKDVKVGDVREFRVSYPEDFASKGLAGKTLDFTTTVIAVRKREVPELDDDFAQQFGEYESIEEMREKVRASLMRDAEAHSDQALRNDLLNQILDSYDFEIPSSLIRQQAAERAQEMAYMMLRSGVSPDEIRGMNWEERIDQARAQATRDVRSALVVERIADAEGINVTEEEIDKEIERMASSTREPVEQLKARLTKDEALSSIENRLRYQKALNLVVDNAEIAAEELTETKEAQQTASEADAAEESQAAEKS